MLDEYQDLIEELLGTPKLVREAVAGGDDPELARMLTVLHERDGIVLSRLQRLIRETAPHFKALPAFDAAVTAGSSSEVPAFQIDSFETTRGDLVSLLMNLTLKDWERTATHDAGGEVSLVDEVEEHVEFDEAFRAKLGSTS